MQLEHSKRNASGTHGVPEEPQAGGDVAGLQPSETGSRTLRRRSAPSIVGDDASVIEINVDDIGPEQVARMVKRRMLHLIPTSPTGNDIACLMKVVQVLPGWREGFVLAKQRADPDADVDLMTLEQAAAEVERLMKIAKEQSPRA